MKRTSNTQRLASASLIAASCLTLMPLTTYAVSARTSTTSVFCTNLSNKAATITGQMTNLTNKVNAAWATQNQKIASEEQQVDTKVTADRQRADADRASNFTKLEGKAKTDDQKQAVQTYEAAVTAAINTRRAAYDAARQTFRDGVKAAVSGHQGNVQGQVSAFQSSVNNALSTAEASCASSPNDGATIRATLQASLKTARQTFNDERQDDGKVGSQVRQLAATRTAAFQAADKTFQASMSAARQALEKAFGSTSV